jgi:hypothetical protein
MKKRILTGAGPVILALFLGAAALQDDKTPPQTEPAETPVTQEYPTKKPKSDYMSSILGRNTKPLGLKEDLALRKLLRQPAIRWAVRSGQRHVLD